MGVRHTGLVRCVVCDDCDIVSARRLYRDASGRRASKLCVCGGGGGREGVKIKLIVTQYNYSIDNLNLHMQLLFNMVLT